MAANEKGAVLILVIAIIVLSGILIFSSIMFVRETLDFALVKENQLKAINAAQCGIYKAVEDFKRLGVYNSASDAPIWGNEYYTIGGGSGFFQVNTNSMKFISDFKTIDNIGLNNINGASSISITNVTISWAPNNSGEHLTKVSIGGTSWIGSVNSGVQVPLNYTLASSSSANMRIQWDTAVNAKTITALFTFSDGSTVLFDMLANGKTTGNSFIIKSTGKVVSNITWKRTLTAQYDAGSGKITAWNETNSHL